MLYQGEFPGEIGFLVSVRTDVVLGDYPNLNLDFLSLSINYFITVGFTNETVIDEVGNDIFIREVEANGETANIFVSSDLVNFIFLGEAKNNVTTEVSIQVSAISLLLTQGYPTAINSLPSEGGIRVEKFHRIKSTK